MASRTEIHFAHLPKEYAGLCALLMPRPIHDAAEYAKIAEITDAMALWQNYFSPDQRDYFELLCSIMEDHDREHVRWPKVSVRVRLQHLLTESQMTAADLSRLLNGSRNLGAMILRSERNLTLAHVRKLAAHLHVSPELFV